MTKQRERQTLPAPAPKITLVGNASQTEVVSVIPNRSSVQHDFIQRQKRVGMSSVRAGMVAREPSSIILPREDDPALNAVDPELLRGGKRSKIDLFNWPDALPRANRVTAKLPNKKRDPDQDTNIVVKMGWKEAKSEDTFIGPFDQVVTQSVWDKQKKAMVKKEYVIHAPSLENADQGYSEPLSDTQESLIEIIRTNRRAVDAKKKHGSGAALELHQYGGTFGWVYGGRTDKDATPTAVQGDDFDPNTLEGKKKRAEKAIWKELAKEGSSASINAYDSQMVTWGRGLGAKGTLPTTMTELMKDEAIATDLMRLGVCYRNGWLVVNTITGAIETGNNALAIMQTDPHILSALIEIGETQEYKQKIADAQWKGIRAAKTSLVPFNEALDWDESLIQWMAHINHWGPAYGWWGAGQAAYQEAGPDAFKLLVVFCKVMANTVNPNGAYSIRNQGPATIANFKHWGGGIGGRELDKFQRESLSDQDITTNEAHRGKIIIVENASKDKNGKMACRTYLLEP